MGAHGFKKLYSLIITLLDGIYKNILKIVSNSEIILFIYLTQKQQETIKGISNIEHAVGRNRN